MAAAFALANGAGVAQGAPSADAVQSITVEASVSPDGVLTVSERVAASVGAGDITRTLPRHSALADGQRVGLDITVRSATVNGEPATFEVEVADDVVQVRIAQAGGGSGVMTYALAYDVIGALRVATAQDRDVESGIVNAGDVEMTWNVMAPVWEVPVDWAFARITGPGDVVAAACRVGTGEALDRCSDRIFGRQVTMGAADVPPGHRLTGVVAWDGSAFTAVPPQRIIEAPGTGVAGIARALAPYALAAGAAGLVAMAAVLLRRRRRA